MNSYCVHELYSVCTLCTIIFFVSNVYVLDEWDVNFNPVKRKYESQNVLYNLCNCTVCTV